MGEITLFRGRGVRSLYGGVDTCAERGFEVFERSRGPGLGQELVASVSAKGRYCGRVEPWSAVSIQAFKDEIAGGTVKLAANEV